MERFDRVPEVGKVGHGAGHILATAECLQDDDGSGRGDRLSGAVEHFQRGALDIDLEHVNVL